MSQKAKIAGWIAAGALAGALATVSLQTAARSATAPLPLEQLQQLAAVFGLIKSDYVEPVDEKKLITDAISGMVSGLDPHSQYFDAKAFKEFKESTTGRFVGVGIEITEEDGLIRVISPIEDTPADRAGILPGDLITQVDDTAVKGMTLSESVKRIRGEPGTKVRLTIYRKEESRTFPVTITRAEIQTHSVKGKLLEPGYAWLRVSQFQQETVGDFVSKINQLYKEDPDIKGLVLDLRNDPGGLLNAAIAVSAAFLPHDVTVVSTDGQIEESKSVYKTIPQDYMQRHGKDPLAALPDALKEVPMVVLVNAGSASASEIVAGALQAHHRAVIMGSQTFGKGSVQTIRPLGPDTALKLTTARYYTPDGESIQAKGIVPDIAVDDTADGSPLAALRTREIDLQHHLVNGAEDGTSSKARDKAREAALKRLEEEAAKNDKPKRPPQYGSDDDFPLQQALAQLKGEPVKVSQAINEDSDANPEDGAASED